MSPRRIQLVYFAGCPNVDATREVLAAALRGSPQFECTEVDTTAKETPESLRQWGSPTILVDGKDVAGEDPSGSSCRIYSDHDPRGRGVPSLELVRRALKAASTIFKYRRTQ